MEVFNELKKKLKGKIVILGMGNPLKGDDGLGTILAKNLEQKIKLNVFSAGTTPENYLDSIIQLRPDTILIIDAADFGGEAGELRIFKPDEINTLNLFSTHNISPALMIDYLQNSTSANIIFLAVQPKDISLGEGFSTEIKKRMIELEGFFIKFIGNRSASIESSEKV